MSVTKAVVLAAGAGSRMRRSDPGSHLTDAQRQAAERGHKAMMPIAQDRPFLDYILSSLADAGMRQICLVVGAAHDAVRHYYNVERRPTRLVISFAQQEVPDGTAHALLTAEGFAGNDGFLVLNADNLYPVAVLRALADLDHPGLAAFERDALIKESGFPLDRVATFALLDIGPDGRLERIVEKPGVETMTSAGPHARVSMNVWRFDRSIFDACRSVRRSARGEFELPEAVALALRQGIAFHAVPSRGAILDLSSRADVASVAKQLAGQSAIP